MKPKSTLRHFLLLASSTLLAAPLLHADTLYWDANGATAGQTDGAGVWLNANQWWNGSANTTWTSGDDAVFGWAGAGGAVTLASPTTVNSLTFKYFTGTYTLGTTGQAITLNNGITRIGGAGGTLNISSPLVLAGAQTWSNNSIGVININGPTTLNGALTIDGSGIINSTATAAVIGGTGDIIKNGTGQFNFSAGGTAPVHTFTGDIVVNGGSIGFQASGVLTGRNVHLTDGYLGGRFGSGFTWTGGLGTGANQIRITGGTSGLSGEGNSNSGFQIGTAGSTLVWGASGEGSATGFFNPDVLLLNGNHRMNSNGKGSLNNGIDLNGKNRIITSTQITNGASDSGFTVSGAIINSHATDSAGLTKTGTGNLILTANNTYNGATAISGGSTATGTNPIILNSSGSITLSGANGRLSATNALNLSSGGILRMVSNNAQNTVDRLNDTAAINVNGGGGLWWENAAGANSFAETVGNVTVNSGAFNVNLTTNQTGAGDQTLTLGTLTRNGTSSLAFSAGVTGPEASGNKNMIVVTGGGTTPAGEIIGAWATTGTAPNVQTDYAVFDNDYVTPLGAAANNVETTWTSTNNIHFDDATTLTDARTVNTLRYSGAANELALGSNQLETFGLLNGGSGLLSLSGTGALTTLTGGGQLHVTTGSNNIIVANPITDNDGAVTLVKSGSAAVTAANNNISTQGTLVLNGVNTYTGDTIINGGTLRIGTNNTANGAKLGGASGNYAGNIAINGGGMLLISTNANQELSGIISGDGALFKTYNGTLTLSGDNTYTGKTSIAPSTTAGAGTLVVSSFNSVNGGTPLMASSSLGAPTTVENGTIDLGGPTNIQGGATLRYVGSGETTDRVINIQMGANTSRTIDASGSGLLKFTSAFTSVGGTFATTTIQLIGTGSGEITEGLPFAVPNLTKGGTGTWTLGGDIGISGTTTINGGGTLEINGTFSGGLYANTITFNNSSTLKFNSTSDQTLTGVISGAGALIKDNTGTLKLTGTNTYTGATTVSAGKLVIDGSTSSTSLVTVASGATLSGMGTVGAAATVAGFLKPGSSAGELAFGSSLTLQSTATTTMEIVGLNMVRGVDYDGIDVGTSLAYGGSLILDFGTLFGAGNYTFNLFDFGIGNDSGDFASVTLAGLYSGSLVNNGSGVWGLTDGDDTWTFTQSSGNLNLAVIPEPRAALLGGLGLLMLLRRRR